jgi:hypothetical protein
MDEGCDRHHSFGHFDRLYMRKTRMKLTTHNNLRISGVEESVG